MKIAVDPLCRHQRCCEASDLAEQPIVSHPLLSRHRTLIHFGYDLSGT